MSIAARTWTVAEDELLRAHYASGYGRAPSLPSIPGRTPRGAWRRARRIGIGRYRPWTERDDRRLGELWAEGGGIERVARELGRTEDATYARGRELGLTAGVPQGCEYLSHAAKRTGYEVTQLRGILAWAGVRLRQHVARPTEARGKARRHRRYHFVDSFDVDAPVERWHTTETPTCAARRHGVSCDTIRRWLRAAGHAPPAKRKVHWRIATAIVDDVVAARRTHLEQRAGEG